MKEEKTTREILAEKMAAEERPPLYNPAALEVMRRRVDAWMHSTVREKDRREWLKTPRTVLGSDIPREMLYTPLSHPDFAYQQDLGNSGEAPFTRGIHANTYRGREFTMRQPTGFGSPADTNARMKV